MLKALFLDLDGTLVDSPNLLWSAYSQFLLSHNVVPTEEEFLELNGPTIPQIVSILKGRHFMADSEAELVESYLSSLELGYQQVKENPGSTDLLQAANTLNIPVALVTSCIPRLYTRALTSLNWHKYFQVVISPNQDEPCKPDPSIYLRALAELGITNSEKVHCLAIEDSRQGVLSAVGAGISTIAICNCANRDALIAAGAAAVFPSLADAWRSSL